MAYISDWLTHFVGQHQSTDDARCELLIKILRDQQLGQWEQHGTHLFSSGSMLISSSGSLCKDEFVRFRPVCFCDIPEDSFRRHTDIYGRFGLAFRKGFLVTKGANPVFYIAKGSVAAYERSETIPLTLKDVESDPRMAFERYFATVNAEPTVVRRCEMFDRLVATLIRVLPPPWPEGTPGDARDPVREVQQKIASDLVRHVFAFTKFFDESLPEDDVNNFYMEREWRVSGLVQFELSDIQCVYVAAGFRNRIEQEFPSLTLKELDSIR